MKTYVCGFILSKNKAEVLLIEKDHPEWQRGRYNGIGGKIEPGETPFEALVREVREECGLDAFDVKWHRLCTLTGYGESWEVHFYKGFTSNIHKARSLTKEKVSTHMVEELGNIHHSSIVPNLKWLIPMAVCESEPTGYLRQKEVFKK
jgi:8-oxo-dGTP diphosphatase